MADNTVTLATPCREYRGARNALGYGVRNRPIRRLPRWIMAQVHGEASIRGKVIMHLCDNPPCFRYDHLRIASRGENLADAYNKGRRTPQRRLSTADVSLIRASPATQESLALRFGVSRSLISMIRSDRRRKNG